MAELAEGATSLASRRSQPVAFSEELYRRPLEVSIGIGRRRMASAHSCRSNPFFWVRRAFRKNSGDLRLISSVEILSPSHSEL